MTENSSRNRSDVEAAYAGFGDAITRLADSMDCLSTDMCELDEATARLETSTRALSRKQGEISEQMARTAEEIRDTRQTTDSHPQSTPVAPADD